MKPSTIVLRSPLSTLPPHEASTTAASVTPSNTALAANPFELGGDRTMAACTSCGAGTPTGELASVLGHGLWCPACLDDARIETEA